MRILCSIVQATVLTVFHTGQDLPLGSAIAGELVRDDHPWDIRAAREQLAEELLRCSFVAPALNQDIEHVPVLIHRAPEILLRATDLEENFVEVPLVPRLGTSAT